tara:strand:+ start:278 stop:949 length:672 start_codon:yes stop_codon:yes gene_type:complete
MNITKRELKQIILEEFDKEMQIQEMMDLDPSMVAGGVAALGGLWYMIKAMKDSVEAGRTKEADEYMADIHRIMAEKGLEVPPPSSSGSSPRGPKSARLSRQLADLKAKRGRPRLAAPEEELGADIAPYDSEPEPESAAGIDIDPRDLERYIKIVNTVRSEMGFRDKSFASASPKEKRSMTNRIKDAASRLISKYGQENLDMAMAGQEGLYERKRIKVKRKRKR